MVLAFEDFLNPDRSALGALEDLPQDGRKLLIGRLARKNLFTARMAIQRSLRGST
jgi:hypothetical protein